jgi:hypothetical protein
MRWRLEVVTAMAAMGFLIGEVLPAGYRCARADEDLPWQVDLRPQFDRFGLVPVAQGRRDVCSLFAVTGLAEFELAKNHPNQPRRLSEEFLTWAANESTGLKGDQAMFVEAVHGLTHLGICTQELMPYADNPDTTRVPSKEAQVDASSRRHWTVKWIKRWDVKTGMTEAESREIRKELADGHPVAIAMRWPKKQRLDRQRIQQVPRRADVYDGHSVILAGYRDDKAQAGGGLFIVRNSFGAEWGDAGYAYFPYGYIAEYGNDALSLRFRSGDDHFLTREGTLRIEGEALRVLSASRVPWSIQEMRPWGAKLWSGGKQLFCRAESGGTMELEFALAQGGRFEIELLATLAPDYGKVQILLDDRLLVQELDGYCGRIEPTGPFPLATRKLEAGKHRLSVSVTGKNPHSSGFAFGIDAIEFWPAK